MRLPSRDTQRIANAGRKSSDGTPNKVDVSDLHLVEYSIPQRQEIWSNMKTRAIALFPAADKG